MPPTIDGSGADPSGGNGPEVVGESERNDRQWNDGETAATAFDVDRLPTSHGVRRNDQHAHARRHRPAESVVEGDDSPRAVRMVTAEPRGQRPPPGRVSLERGAVRLGMLGEVALRREPDGDRPAHPERRLEEALVPDVQSVERPPEDRPSVAPHGGPELDEDREEDDRHHRDGPVEEVGVGSPGSEELLALRPAGLRTGLIRRGAHPAADLAMAVVSLTAHAGRRGGDGP